MNLDTYQQWADSKLGGEMVTLHSATLACALGLAGEAGEVVDLVKKHWCHAKPLDREKLKLELGDTLYYLACLANEFGMTLSDVATANVAKLEARYPNGFSPQAAAARADEPVSVVEAAR